MSFFVLLSMQKKDRVCINKWNIIKWIHSDNILHLLLSVYFLFFRSKCQQTYSAAGPVRFVFIDVNYFFFMGYLVASFDLLLTVCLTLILWSLYPITALSFLCVIWFSGKPLDFFHFMKSSSGVSMKKKCLSHI